MNSRWLSVIAAACCGFQLAVLGCRPALQSQGAPSAPAGPADELSLVMGDELRAAREEGAGDSRLGLVGVGIPGDSLGGVVQLPEDACMLLMGRGAAGVQDVDLFAFADDGTVLASDESPAKAATLIMCPPQPPRAFVSGRLAAGFGLFAVSAQAFDVDRLDGLATRFGVMPNRAPAARDIDGGWPGLEERLVEHRRSLGGEWESLRKVALPLDPRAYATVSTRVDADRCVDVLLTPSDDVAHLELEVLESSGRWIGSGRSRGAERNLTVCSSETRDLTLRCRPHAGRGLAALVISRSSPGASRQLGSHTARFDLRPAVALPQLRQEQQSRLAGLGYGPVSFSRDGRLELERRSSLSLPLPRGCSRIDVLTAAPVSSIRAWLWDEAGHLVSEDGRSLGATLFACGAKTSARLDLETLARGGDFLVEVRHSAQLPRVVAEQALAASRLLGLLDARGRLSSFERFPEIRSTEVSESELARFDLELRAGRCLELSAALGTGVSGLEIRLSERAPASVGDGAGGGSVSADRWEDDGTLGYGPRAASVSVCAVKPSQDRVVTAELRANVGRGAALWTTHDFALDDDAPEQRRR